jgi:hypothetical protein
VAWSTGRGHKEIARFENLDTRAHLDYGANGRISGERKEGTGVLTTRTDILGLVGRWDRGEMPLAGRTGTGTVGK